MKIEDIISLSKAGFSAEQIATMAAVPTAPAPAPLFTPAPPATPVVPITPAPAVNPLDALMAQIANLTNVVQNNALGNTTMPTATAEDADSILAAIIAPPVKGGK